MNNDLKTKTIEILLQEINEIYSNKEGKLDKKLIGDAFNIEPLVFVDRGLLVFSQEEYSRRLEKLGDYQNKYRYYYFEDFFNNNAQSVIIIMFNPSSANPEKDDPTIANCRKLMKDKYSKMEIINIFAERNPNAKEISINNNSDNISFIESFLNERINVDIVLAWGKKSFSQKENEKLFEKIIKHNSVYILNAEDETKITFAKYNKWQMRHPDNRAWTRLGSIENAKLQDIKIEQYFNSKKGIIYPTRPNQTHK